MKSMRIGLICLLMLAVLASSALGVTYPEGTLYRGIKGHEEEVEFLQYQLFYGGYLGNDIAEVDGVFGKKTETAVKAFQQDHGLATTGIVDQHTKYLLDEAWENSMEPQGGADSSTHCYVEHYANGTTSIVLCEQHLSRYGACANLLDVAWNDEQRIEALQTGITLWLEDIDSIYKAWISLEPEHAELIANIQESFMDYYRANLALWNIQYGSPSMAALEKGQTMLADHCVELCLQRGDMY